MAPVCIPTGTVPSDDSPVQVRVLMWGHEVAALFVTVDQTSIWLGLIWGRMAGQLDGRRPHFQRQTKGDKYDDKEKFQTILAAILIQSERRNESPVCFALAQATTGQRKSTLENSR